MTPREMVHDTIAFRGPERMPYTLTEDFGSDIAAIGMTPSPDARPRSGIDEWGAEWANIGGSNLGQVQSCPLEVWSLWSDLAVPDITEPRRWVSLEGARERAGDRFLLASGISIYERVHFIRGLENAWADIAFDRDNLCRLIDVLVDMNVYAIGRYAEAGADGYIFCDDWGLQDRLMISPRSWREIWKPRYARIYGAAREAGLRTFLHSCGCIVDILDDLIDIGLDVIQMDQQQNMGLDLLGERFGGRITFWNPVDIQNTMARGTTDEIRAYCFEMVRKLGRPEGGFIAKWYGDPKGAGHTPEAITAMCEAFVEISENYADVFAPSESIT